jgi:catechol 2,3-dioxygenase
MITVSKLGHGVLQMRDLERSVTFCRDVLGMREVARFRENMAFFFVDGQTHRDLERDVGAAAPEPPRAGVGLPHVAFKVGDSVEQLRDAVGWLEGRGVQVRGMSDHTVSQFLYLAAPDGNGAEFYVDADPAIWRDDPQAVASVKLLAL